MVEIYVDDKSCKNCNHSEVCGMYDAMWDAISDIDDYDDMQPGYRAEIFKVMANDCVQYQD